MLPGSPLQYHVLRPLFCKSHNSEIHQDVVDKAVGVKGRQNVLSYGLQYHGYHGADDPQEYQLYQKASGLLIKFIRLIHHYQQDNCGYDGGYGQYRIKCQ